MHEMHIVEKVISATEMAIKNKGFKKINLLRFKIGKMAGIDSEQFIFLFENAKKPSILESAKVEIEEIPVELECDECKHVYPDERFDDQDFAHKIAHTPESYIPLTCPKCKANGPKIIKGNEFEISSLDGE